jgi:DNA-binding PadR family transcriptional regulator
MTDPTLLVLSSLAGGDKHGYAMMEDIAAFSGQRLGPGTLYGAITRLEECGWIRGLATAKGDRRRPYTLTAAGREHLEQEIAALSQISRTAARRLKHA